MGKTDRRNFLKTSAKVGVAATVLGAPAIGAAASPNERIRVGLVGAGGRGLWHVDSLHELAGENVELAALCDCDETALAAASKKYEEKSGKTAKIFTDFRRLLDDKNIDAISIAMPNHWHSLATIWACQAGKDVYVEKPGSHNIFEGRKMVEAARKHGRIVQHGTQCRSSANIVEGVRMLQDGVIGRVYFARAPIFKIRQNIGADKAESVPAGFNWDAWLGPAPMRPYSTTRRRGWHYMWDTGNGQLGNQGVHQIDLIRWALDLKTHPTRIQSMGGHYIHDDAQETPDTQTSGFQWDGRDLLVELQTRNWFTNTEAGMGDQFPFVDHESSVGVIFLGSEGYMIFPDYSSYRTFLGKERKPGPFKFEEGNPFMDTQHFRNWIAACRSRKPETLSAEIEEGHLSSAICHLGNVAYRAGRTLKFDPKTERFAGDDEANRLLTREYRSPYVVPKEV